MSGDQVALLGPLAVSTVMQTKRFKCLVWGLALAVAVMSACSDSVPVTGVTGPSGVDAMGADVSVDESDGVLTPDATASELPEAPDGVAGDLEAGGSPDADEGWAYLVVEPESVDFGFVDLGMVLTQSIELENAGSKVLTLTEIGLVNGDGAFGMNLAQVVLGPGQKKELMLTFYGLELGVFEDTLRLESNAINNVVVDVPLRGEVRAPVCDDQDSDGHGIGCVAGGDCNDSDPTIYVGAPERCNGIDDDCDGLYDEDFVGLGTSCEVGFGLCVADGYKICADDQESLRCSVNPVTGGDELCNELDDDCDGATDEDFPSKGKLCTVGIGACAVSDKFVCNEDGTALICNEVPLDPGEEICGDGIDNDCDGIMDEGELEICDDGIDNDCDGETDESGSTWGEVFFARNYYGTTVVIYPSNGDGSFAEPITLDFGDQNNYGVHAVGDFDGDRWLDLVVVQTLTEENMICATNDDCFFGRRCANGVCRLLCDGAGVSCPDGQECVQHVSPQQNTTNQTYCRPPSRVMLARSSCTGTEIELTELFTLQPKERLGPVIDADGNGHLDFMVLDHWSVGTGFTYLNDGDGGFTKLANTFDYSSLFTWSYGLVKTSKDLTGDGRVDMLGRSFNSGGAPPTVLYLFEGLGDGSFAFPVVLGEQVPYPANMITANDFDGDGDQDLVCGLDDDGQPGASWMLLNLDAPDGNAWVTPYEIYDVAPSYNTGGEHPGFGSGTSFDFDGDDQPDTLVGWVPEECGSTLWGCPAITDPSDICYGGYCRKLGFVRNKTKSPCLPGTSCIDGQCVPGCVNADCTGKQCGDDGCNGSCGECGGGQICAGGQCVVDCSPQCDGKVCGDNGCGGICGVCAQGESCLSGQCQAGCVPSCAGKQCGDDGCGGSCAVFEAPAVIAFDDNPSVALVAPTNVPPTRPELSIEPAAPSTSDDLTCLPSVESYDLDAVTYRYRWYVNGSFAADLGEKQSVPAALTAPGQTWQCQVRATDGIEWSQQVELSVTISEDSP